jgi:hypothetical protein
MGEFKAAVPDNEPPVLPHLLHLHLAGFPRSLVDPALQGDLTPVLGGSWQSFSSLQAALPKGMQSPQGGESGELPGLRSCLAAGAPFSSPCPGVPSAICA